MITTIQTKKEERETYNREKHCGFSQPLFFEELSDSQFTQNISPVIRAELRVERKELAKFQQESGC